MSRPTALVAVVASVVFIAIGLRVAGDQSATFDEVPHIGAGVAYLQGDLRLNNEHPPLAKVLAALALPRGGPAPRLPPHVDEDTQWSFGAAWLYLRRGPPLPLLLRARAPLVALCALILPLVGLWGELLAGTFAACAAIGLLALCPLWIAHATLVTTDALASLFFFGAALCTTRMLSATGRARAACAALLASCVALALATKYSMLALPPLLFAAAWIDARKSLAPDARRAALLVCAGALGAGVVLGVSLAWGLPPDPLKYVRGVVSVGGNHRAHYEHYAFGRFSTHTDPSYFLRALLAKVSISVLVLAALAPWLLRRSDAAAARATRFGAALFWLPPLGYFALMSATAPALGVRYVLPVLPFLALLAGAAAALLWQRRALRVLLPVLVAVHLAGLAIALDATPLAFFNGVPCQTAALEPCLDDSNLDWGQALPKLGRFRDQHYPHAPLRVFYFGTSALDAYLSNVAVASIDEQRRPLPALYAVSLHLRLRMAPDAWPRRLPPSSVVGGVYAIYDLRALGRGAASAP